MGYLRDLQENMPRAQDEAELLPTSERGRGRLAMIRKLCHEPAPFDPAYIDVMIRHHEGEITWPGRS